MGQRTEPYGTGGLAVGAEWGTGSLFWAGLPGVTLTRHKRKYSDEEAGHYTHPHTVINVPAVCDESNRRN